MLNLSTYMRVYRTSAWYDLAITWPFALPITFGLLWQDVLSPLNIAAGFDPLPVMDAHAVLFANFFGSVVLVWALVRLRRNDPTLAFYDGLGRLLFTGAMINALMSGATPLLWGFVVIESGFALAQLLGRPRGLPALMPQR